MARLLEVAADAHKMKAIKLRLPSVARMFAKLPFNLALIMCLLSMRLLNTLTKLLE
jgi:hypothetical protein